MRAARGFSLVELMIALLLGLILSLGVVRIFVSSKQGYRVQESAGRMQESMRFAMEAIGREIRHADLWGGVKAINIDRTRAVAVGNSPCTLAWHTDLTNALIGYEGAPSSPLSGCTTNYIPQSDIIALRYADPNGMPISGDISGSDLFVQSLVGAGGFLFPGSSKPPAVAGSLTYRYRSAVLFLGTFKDSTPGVPSVPALYINECERSCTGSRPQPLVEGVEQMQFAYGVDSSGDDVADRFYAAKDMTTVGWNRVVSVRVGIVVRGDQMDSFADGATYALPGDFTYQPLTDEEDRAKGAGSYQRRVIVRDFQVRNRTRG